MVKGPAKTEASFKKPAEIPPKPQLLLCFRHFLEACFKKSFGLLL